MAESTQCQFHCHYYYGFLLFLTFFVQVAERHYSNEKPTTHSVLSSQQPHPHSLTLQRSTPAIQEPNKQQERRRSGLIYVCELHLRRRRGRRLIYCSCLAPLATLPLPGWHNPTESIFTDSQRINGLLGNVALNPLVDEGSPDESGTYWVP